MWSYCHQRNAHVNLWLLSTNLGPENIIRATKQPTRESKTVVSQSKCNKNTVVVFYQVVVSTHQEEEAMSIV